MDKESHHIKSRLNRQGEIDSAVHVVRLSSVDSTQRWAKEHVDQWPESEMLCVVASEQTMGRGRWDRKWLSPSGVNIYASFCFWFDLTRKDVGNIPQVLALAAVEALEAFHFSPSIKWPNDLILSGKKVGGVLCETFTHLDRLGVICGMGLNVNMSADQLGAIDRPATSLLNESGKSHSIDEVLALLCGHFSKKLSLFWNDGFAPFYPQLVKKSLYQEGDALTFHSNGQKITAIWNRLTEEGGVELTLSNGVKKNFLSGEFLV